MDRILCVVREWTDDSRRGADGTAQKMNWTKPLGHGGAPLEDCKVSWQGWQVAWAYGTLSESPPRAAMTTSSPSLPAFRPPYDRDLQEGQWPGDARGACRRGAPWGTSRRESRTHLPMVGGRALTPARAACREAGRLSPPNGPGGPGDSTQYRCPSGDASPSRRMPGAPRGAPAAPTGGGMRSVSRSDSDCLPPRNGDCAETLRVRRAAGTVGCTPLPRAL